MVRIQVAMTAGPAPRSASDLMIINHLKNIISCLLITLSDIFFRNRFLALNQQLENITAISNVGVWCPPSILPTLKDDLFIVFQVEVIKLFRTDPQLLQNEEAIHGFGALFFQKREDHIN